MTRSSCRITHKLSYLGWDMLCTCARPTRMRTAKKRPCSRRDKARVSGETVRKGARTRLPLRPSSSIGAQTYSSETHSEGSHVCRHQQGVDPCRIAASFPAAKRGLGWSLECVQFMQYLRFHGCGVYEGPYEDQHCWPWVTAWQKRHRNPDRTALRRAFSICSLWESLA